MNIELLFNGITEYNRYSKLLKAAHILSDHMGLDAEITMPVMEKMQYKYIDKIWQNGKWVYIYKNKQQNIDIASKCKLIKIDEEPLEVEGKTFAEIKALGKYYINKNILPEITSGKVICKELGNRKITSFDLDHLDTRWNKKTEKYEKRSLKDLKDHVKFLPFILPIIREYGIIKTADDKKLNKKTGKIIKGKPKGRRSYEIIGKADVEGEKYAISVILKEMGKNDWLNLQQRSVFGFKNKMIKSLAGDGWSNIHEHHAGQPTTLPKIDHLPLIISDFSVMSINNYPNLEISIQNITPENRKMKFAKAMRAVSKHLKIPVNIARKGEPYLYNVQQELSDQWTGYYSGIIKKIYKAVITALGLPEVEVETMRKALGDGTTAVWMEKGKRRGGKYIAIIDGRYIYPDDIPVIKGANKLNVNASNYQEVLQNEVKKLKEKIGSGLYCAALGNKKVVGIKESHIESSHGNQREQRDLFSRIAIMPYIIPIIEQGIKTKEKKNPNYEGNYYEISGMASKNERIKVILADKGDGCLYISVMNKKMIRKSLHLATVHCQDLPTLNRYGFSQGAFLTGRNGYNDNHTLIIPYISAMSIEKPSILSIFMNKARRDEPLRVDGKLVYNPETGQPLKIGEMDDLIESIEKFLNRNTKDISKKLVLDSAAIGKLLKRMAKYQSSEALKQLTLDKLKYRGKTFDWIRQDIKNLNSVLGDAMSGIEMARYQVAQDYVANLVTGQNDKLRRDIKDTVLQGIINKRSKGQVSQDLFNKLGSHNRDWKRIADTEIVNTSNLAGILYEVHNAPEGEKVYFKRYELPGCCDKCAKVNGMIVLWSDTPLTDDRIKDPYAKVAIWEGKPQEKGKLSIVTGTLHPSCRGGWTRWGGKEIDAITAQLQDKAKQWDAAVKEAKAEFQEKGTDNPNDATPGYVDRINELYKEKLGE